MAVTPWVNIDPNIPIAQYEPTVFSNIDNARIADGAYAAVTINSYVHDSTDLDTYFLPIAIVPGAAIENIEVSIKGFATTNDIRVYAYLYRESSPGNWEALGTSSTTVKFPVTDGYFSALIPSANFNRTLTPEDLTALNVYLLIQSNHSSAATETTINVDEVRVRAQYSQTGTPVTVNPYVNTRALALTPDENTGWGKASLNAIFDQAPTGITWDNPNNIFENDGNYATYNFTRTGFAAGVNEFSDAPTLLGWTYDRLPPDTATITGLEVLYKGYRNGTVSGLQMNVFKNPNVAYRKETYSLPTTDTSTILGGPNDRWYQTGTNAAKVGDWTPADVASSTGTTNFPTRIQFFMWSNVTGAQMLLDTVQMRWHYVNDPSQKYALTFSAASSEWRNPTGHAIWNQGGTSTPDGTAGAPDWSNIPNMYVPDGSFSTIGIDVKTPGGGNTFSDVVYLNGYGHNIPANATITGVEARVNALSGPQLTKLVIGLLKPDGTSVNQTFDLTTSTTIYTVAHSNTTFSQGITPAIANSANMRVLVYGYSNVTGATVSIDSAQLRFTYEVPSGAGLGKTWWNGWGQGI